MTESFPVDKIVTNANTQCRVAMDKDTVARYADMLGEADKWPFPDLKLTYDGETYFLASGFHRLAAAKVHRRSEVPVEIFAGGAAEAFYIGLRDNKGPMSPTPDDRRYSAERLLQGKIGLPKADIAELCGLSKRTVQRIASDLDRDTGDSVTGTHDHHDEGDGGVNDDAGTGPSGMDAPPPPAREGPTEGGGASSTQDTKPPKRNPVAIQKAKTVKTAEALCRAFDDLQELQPGQGYERVSEVCVELVTWAKAWGK